jgi:hypothetical protein
VRPTPIENARSFPARLSFRLDGGSTKRVLQRSHAYWMSVGDSWVLLI